MVSDKLLYDESQHHDACGLGFVVRSDGRDSREIVEQGLVVLSNLNHRGTVNADGKTGDGAGLLVQIPHAFLKREMAKQNIDLPEPGYYGAGTCFFWGDDEEISHFSLELEKAIVAEGQHLIGWRDVPVEPVAIGDMAREVMPTIRQFFVARHINDESAFQRKLYVIRRRVHRNVERLYGSGRFYVVSLSTRTIVYKGLLQGTQVASFFTDLQDASFSSALALVHSRFSTNTLGNWALAHPYRFIAHNGEINTLRGNLNWMRARESQFESELFGDDMAKLHPVIELRVSDSAAFDNALEFLHLSGRSLPQAMMTMVPEAWESNHAMPPDRRAFYHYSTALMQPWDGPAAIAFTDGRMIGGSLDRNGLRPSRYCVTKDGLVVLASEDGVLPIDPADISERWRLGPGQMITVDLERGLINGDEASKESVVSAKPYRDWVFENTVGINDPIASTGALKIEETDLVSRQRAFGYTFEDVRLLIAPMASTGKEADGSMGTDTPVAILSNKPKRLFDYFHQLFAQVTNPPIDPLRERGVMSLRVSLGPAYNLLEDGPQHARRIILPTPILTDVDVARLQNMTEPSFKTATVSLLWDVDDGAAGLRRALLRICDEAVYAIHHGATILVLSDRGITQDRLAIPSLLATSAIHHHLIRSNLGGSAGLVVETGEAREIHHFATLIAFGAAAVNPYLALETVTDLVDKGEIAPTALQARRHYVDALNKGMLKVISKMGISTVHSYTGSQLFEIIGLGEGVVERFFTGGTSRMNGLQLEGLAREALETHRRAFDTSSLGVETLDPGGEYQMRDGTVSHQWNENTIPALQRAVRTNTYDSWEVFSKAADGDSRARNTLRSLLRFKPVNEPVPLDEVEPATEIVKRFSTGAMSMGSISKEAHETVAVAMNRIGARSNSGEGGEDPARFMTEPNGDRKRSAIKQIASGRFGVTTDYLMNGDMLQIKVAQGAKPGEGGQLPGHKVSDEIARLRYSTPGVGLISPPPHHDIYSIEDLSQLIYDLHMVNPAAAVSVKLVAEAGVGTIAAGVAKAKADHITISGYDGGTGAAPQSSIKHAGVPWELGLAEAQQVLVNNALRGRVRLQTDGMLRTGRDVAIAALLGADEFGFSTAPLVAMGCVMMRVCHLNTCPVGIATQNPELRKRFRGQPEDVINYFFFVAEELRQIMATLGYRTVDEMIGKVQNLRRDTGRNTWKSTDLDFDALLHVPHANVPLHQVETQDPRTEDSFDSRLLPHVSDAIVGDHGQTVEIDIHNTDRTIGARLSGVIAKHHGPDGLNKPLHLIMNGVSGQSFGAFGAKGLRLSLTGSTNDYAGKGLSGAILAVKPPENASYTNRRHIITGNVALYGATSGQAYFAGAAGERFAVRNSGATAVVEGLGDHGCEYMTGGIVVVLGDIGRNFAAGMSGGIAYVLAPRRDVRNFINTEMVGLSALSRQDADDLAVLLQRHQTYTGSEVAGRLLQHWPQGASDFVKVIPHDLKRVLDAATEGIDESVTETVNG